MAKKMAQITRMGVLYLSFLFILIFWTTDNGLQTHPDGIHPEGCLLSVVSSPLSSFYQSTFFSTIAERAGMYSFSHSFL